MFNIEDDYEAPKKPLEVNLEDEDVIIEDVSPKKKEVPMFTKKGKMVIALIVLGTFGYYLWSKRKGVATQSAEQPEVKPVEVAEKPIEVVEPAVESIEPTTATPLDV
jgi:hypothetical protein